MQKSDCIISVEHVSKFFGDKAVLNDVNLFVRKGEFVTILGPSGCGKTTLLRLIAGFQTASEGEISIAGKEITQTPPHKRPVNTVFQKYALFPHLNVFNNIAFGLKLKKLPSAVIEKKVKQALKMVGMTDYEYRDVDSLSGGQQQRVAIARAIAARPPIIMADEPTGNLDTRSGEEVMKILHELNEEGRTIVLITHDNDIARQGHPVPSGSSMARWYPIPWQANCRSTTYKSAPARKKAPSCSPGNRRGFLV